MVAIADLKHATRLAGERNTDAAALQRLAGAEMIRILVGGDPKPLEIIITSAFQAELRGTLTSAIASRIADTEAALRKLGVEP